MSPFRFRWTNNRPLPPIDVTVLHRCVSCTRKSLLSLPARLTRLMGPLDRLPFSVTPSPRCVVTLPIILLMAAPRYDPLWWAPSAL